MWGGAFDPTLGYYVINTTDSGSPIFIRKTDPPLHAAPYGDPDGDSPFLYTTRPQMPAGTDAAAPRSAFAAFSFSANGWPCWAPPWGRLTAVNVNTGDIAWQIPYGTMAGVPPEIKTGAPNVMGGPTITAGGLIFMVGSTDRYIRALETKTGKEIWSFKLNVAPTSVPIVYMGRQGKEYVAVVAGRALVSFALGGQTSQAKMDSSLTAQTPLPEGIGRNLVEKTCSTCHSVDTIASRRQNRGEWTNTVQRMAQYGASATDEEFNTIVDYLTKNFGNGSDNDTGSKGNVQPNEQLNPQH
jgi:hypothetical protein